MPGIASDLKWQFQARESLLAAMVGLTVALMPHREREMSRCRVASMPQLVKMEHAPGKAQARTFLPGP